MRDALADASAKQRTAVAAIPKMIVAQETKVEAEAQWEIVADALREKQPKLGALMGNSRDHVLAYMSCPCEHQAQTASTNKLERVDRGVKRRSDVIGIFPPTTRPSFAWSAYCCSRPMIKGRLPGDTCPLKRSPA